MTVVIAVDSFKGSCTAREAAEYMSRGVRRVFPGAEMIKLPIADGGEGTVEALVSAAGGREVTVDTFDPLGRPIAAAYGVLPDGTAVVETAAASGLTLIAREERDALRASTYGTGVLICHALSSGARRMILGLGGSATTDGGAGIARALGVRFLDSAGRELPPGGAALADLAEIDISGLMPEARECEFILACDVKNKLCGTEGAAYVFAPQKGADARQVRALDAALANFARVLKTQFASDAAEREGSGAAGGLGCVFMAWLNCAIRPGVDLVLDTIGFEAHVRRASLVLTGEGRLDAQSAYGKVPDGVARRAKKVKNVPVIAIGGSIGDGAEQLYSSGVDAMESSVDRVTTLDAAMANAAANIEAAAERAMRLISAGMRL